MLWFWLSEILVGSFPCPHCELWSQGSLKVQVRSCCFSTPIPPGAPHFAPNKSQSPFVTSNNVVPQVFIFLKERIKSRDRVCAAQDSKKFISKASILWDMEQTDPGEGSSLTLHYMRVFISMGRIFSPSPSPVSLILPAGELCTPFLSLRLSELLQWPWVTGCTF